MPPAREADTKTVSSSFSFSCDTANYFETEAQRSQSVVVNNAKGI